MAFSANPKGMLTIFDMIPKPESIFLRFSMSVRLTAPIMGAEKM